MVVKGFWLALMVALCAVPVDALVEDEVSAQVVLLLGPASTAAALALGVGRAQREEEKREHKAKERIKQFVKFKVKGDGKGKKGE